ncbi:hypothetical protein J6500_08450 [Bradyrhizobium sp. WSM 1704]|uniref:hypothetical protein n=1 Tax=Bradyrhizobium semiaridum TaxID=2821404 RepID=UPI001CE3A97B|nr:hypothetical protein [Bradyrhizobium semiaridum]MCA6121926.1 hypothetical protein [Bradyrhizobium semiaridum]
MSTPIIATGIFAGRRMGTAMCQYGGLFCESPTLVLVGAGLAAAWGTFVSVR